MAERLPPAIRKTALQLARQAQRASDDESARLHARREALLGEYGFTSRIREDETGHVLICYPAEWIADGTIDREAIDDLERAEELPLDEPSDGESWSAIAANNRKLADRIREAHGPVHGANADALVSFANNHRAAPIRAMDGADIEEFLTEYYPRNAWPSEAERAAIDESIELVLEMAESVDH